MRQSHRLLRSLPDSHAFGFLGHFFAIRFRDY